MSQTRPSAAVLEGRVERLAGVAGLHEVRQVRLAEMFHLRRVKLPHQAQFRDDGPGRQRAEPHRGAGHQDQPRESRFRRHSYPS
jgi:hypothetical protein